MSSHRLPSSAVVATLLLFSACSDDAANGPLLDGGIDSAEVGDGPYPVDEGATADNLAEHGQQGDVDAPAVCSAPETALRSPLSERLRLLWSAEINSLGIKNQVAAAAGRIAVSAGATLFMFDKTGAPRGTWRNPSNAQLSAPTASVDGRFFVASDVVAAVNGEGQQQWLHPLRTDNVFQAPVSQPLLLSPDGRLFSLQPDGRLKALRATDGMVLWQKTVGAAGNSQARFAAGGVGNFLVVNGGNSGMGFVVYDATSGSPLWEGKQPESGSGEGLTANSALAGIGVLAARSMEGGQRWGLWDWEGERRWLLELQPQFLATPAFVDQSGHPVFVESRLPIGGSDPQRLVRLSCDGARLGHVDLLAGAGAAFGSFAARAPMKFSPSM